MRITNRGFSMVEAMVSGVLVIGLGAVIVGISDNEKRSTLGLKDKSDLNRAMNIIGEKISDANTCRLNFLNKDISEPLRISELKDKNGDTIVKEGEVFENRSDSPSRQDQVGNSHSHQNEQFEQGHYAAKEIFIKDYDSSKNRVQLRILFERSGQGVASKSLNKFFNFYARVEANIITECLDPVEQTAFGSMMKSCYDVDPKLKGICEENFQNLLGEVKRIYCTGHPILEYDSASEKCKVLDGEKVCAGGFIQGFSDTGSRHWRVFKCLHFRWFLGVVRRSKTPNKTPQIDGHKLFNRFSDSFPFRRVWAQRSPKDAGERASQSR